MAWRHFVLGSAGIALWFGTGACGGATSVGPSEPAGAAGGGSGGVGGATLAGTGGASGNGGVRGGGAGSSDAAIETADAAAADAAIETACQDCFVLNELHWGMDGGFVAYADTSRLGPCRSYTHERDMFANSLPVMCATMLPGCPERMIDRIDRAIRDPILAAALQAHELYGSDPRPVDGQVFRVGVGQDFIDVGGPCGSGAQACKDPPGVVRDLVSVLQSVDTFALSTEPCKSVFPP